MAIGTSCVVSPRSGPGWHVCLVLAIAATHPAAIAVETSRAASQPAAAAASAPKKNKSPQPTEHQLFNRQWHVPGHINGPGCRRKVIEEICSSFAPQHTTVEHVVVARSGQGTRFVSFEETKPGCAKLVVELGRDHTGVAPNYVCRGPAALLILKLVFKKTATAGAPATSPPSAPQDTKQ